MTTKWATKAESGPYKPELGHSNKLLLLLIYTVLEAQFGQARRKWNSNMNLSRATVDWVIFMNMSRTPRIGSARGI